MKIVFALFFLLTGYLIYDFQSLELWFLNKNFSWTMSKLLPYTFLIIAGILLAYSFSKAFKLKSKVLKFTLGTLLFVLPFALGFAFNPIYEGDFSSEGQEITSAPVSYDEKYQLVVVTIPNCPFCLEAIGRLKLMKKQHPELQILYSVCSSDEKSLSFYKEQIDGAFDISLAQDIDASAKLAEGRFPTFLYIEKGIPTIKWSNDQFGAGAIDELFTKL